MARPKYKSDRSRDTPRRRPERPGKAAGKAAPAPVELPPRRRREGARLAEAIGGLKVFAGDTDFALLDSGNGEKLERYGALTVRRPEGQAVWLPRLAASDWEAADATFTAATDEEGAGRWRFREPGRGETFPLAHDGMAYLGRFTSFRHTGVFPEQAAHWADLTAVVAARTAENRPVRMLNLFGYTGLASLLAARAGAHVTHVDASKKAIGWTRENLETAGLGGRPVRLICDDALKFAQREVRRGQTYDIVLLDPPAFGRGPKGEVWQLFEHLPHMLDAVRGLQSSDPAMTILTAYAIRASHVAIHELMQEAFAGMTGEIRSGELVLREEERAGLPSRHLGTSMYARYAAPDIAALLARSERP